MYGAIVPMKSAKSLQDVMDKLARQPTNENIHHHRHGLPVYYLPCTFPADGAPDENGTGTFVRVTVTEPASSKACVAANSADYKHLLVVAMSLTSQW